MLRTSELDYDLPEAAIATLPASPRDSAKLLVVHRARGGIEHLHIRDLPDLLTAGDLLVRNSTRVLPARFHGVRTDTGGKVEGLFLRDEPGLDGRHRCSVLLKMRRHSRGAAILLADRKGNDSGVRMVIEDGRDESADSGILERPHADGAWLVRIEVEEGADPQDWLSRVGLTPLPPYILAARKRQSIQVADQIDRLAYQTVFAKEPAEGAVRPEQGSVAAPTAGLHFTPGLLSAVASRGILTTDVVLHIGLGTFKPVEAEFVEQHSMHTEWCKVQPRVARLIAHTRNAERRIVAVGTTAARTLESFQDAAEMEATGVCSTRLLITPGHRWKNVDALLTNFHLPRSTLMAMVASLLPGGAAQLRELYTDALSRGYRFYSYGDAMLIL